MDIREIRQQLKQKHAAGHVDNVQSQQSATNLATDQQDRRRFDTAPKSHTGTRGLFAHIQSNNAKSLLALLFFVFLIALIQVAVTSATIPTTPYLSDSQAATFKELMSGKPNDMSAFKPLIAEAQTLVRETQEARAKLSPFGKIKFDLSILYDNFWIATNILNPLSYIFFVMGLVYVVVGLIFSSLFVKRQPSAKRVTREQATRLHRIIEKLTLARGLPMPAVEIIDSSGCNAYASGFHPRNSAIGVTSALVNTLNDIELEAVLAHEVAHIEGRDNRLMTIANLCTGVVTETGNKVVRSFSKQPLRSILAAVFLVFLIPFSSILVFVFTAGVAYWLAQLLRTMISRKREFIADARAIEIMKSPAALISALRKVAANDHVEGIGGGVQAMMISNLSGTGLATHPPIDARIRAIEETTTVNNTDFIAVRRMQSPSQAIPQFVEGYAPAKTGGFGNRRVQNDQPQSGPSAPTPELENEKLEGVYQTLKKVDSGMSSVSGGLVKFMAFSWLLPFVLMLLAIVSAITGLSLSTSLIVVVLGIGFWWRHKKHKIT